MTSCKYLIAFFMVVTTIQDVHAAQPARYVSIQPHPFVVPAAWPDALEVLSPSDVRIEGWLGNRVILNEKNRLAQVDLEPLLAGFRQKPGEHTWIGEHIGKWMHAATLAWANTADPQLRAKLDYAVAELIKAQEPDGYLGTYIPEKRFGLYDDADWDVWAHKYNLIGLLTYYQYTGNQDALNACRRIGDLLIDTFPAERSIIAAGTHVGMAATSVLEPMVLLYRLTGDDRYLAFCRYIVTSWSEPDGPKIIESLLGHGQVNKTANGKAYEMLSNLVGLCELARATGDRGLLKPVLNAWQDIVDKRLYITGASTQQEGFHDDHDLPNRMGAHVGEQCVTTTWIQLNWQLLRLTGQTRFGHQLEKTFYNQLSAAQRPDGRQWCYFTAPQGTKRYGPGISCCVSSGPRAMALVPQSAVLRIPAAPDRPETLVINLWDSITVHTQVSAQDVILKWQTDFPHKGRARLKVQSDRPMACSVRIRIPTWAQPCTAKLVGGSGGTVVMEEDTLVLSAQDWTDVTGEVAFHLGTDMIVGDHGNTGRRAFSWGPFVLAYDQGGHIDAPMPMRAQVPANTSAASLQGVSLPGGALQFTVPLGELRKIGFQPCTLAPYADAGTDGTRYAVWLHLAGSFSAANQSLFSYADESRNAPGGEDGSITDNNADTFVLTFNKRLQPEAWFAVEQEEAQTFNRIVFMQGSMFHDGGWFDVTGGGQPQVQIKSHSEAAWETVAQIADYPQTTSTQSAGLTEGQTFTVHLPKPVKATALRVVGRAACGDNPNQSFASCAELQAFEISSSVQGSTTPNVIFILVDDLGWKDLGCYGSTFYQTPHIDRLAEEGLRFTNGYAACNVCSPTRAAIMTGKYPARLLLTQWLPSGRWSRTQNKLREGRYLSNLPLEEVTIAETLREAGYRTAFMGKWHLGTETYYYPEHQGFDLNVAGRDYGAPGSYFYPFEGRWEIPTTGKVLQKESPLSGQEGDYLVDRLAEEAETFIRTHADQPFFLMLSHYAVHTPLQGKPDKVARYEQVAETQRQGKPAYAAMVESVDDSVGRIMKALRELKLDEQTLVIFTSDNGGYAGATDNSPLRANKGSNYEGGIRVPVIIKWPGHTKPGSISHEPVISMDFYPTILAATAQRLRPHQHVDGKNLSPILTGSSGLHREAIYWHYPHYNGHPQSLPSGVIRAGDWKLIEAFETGELSLYNLSEDLGERNDLSENEPQKVKELYAKLSVWRADVGADLMKPNPEYEGGK